MEQTRRLAAAVLLTFTFFAVNARPVASEPNYSNQFKVIDAKLIDSTKKANLPIVRTFRVTAYTSSDKGMNGKGVTASGALATPYRTVAADPNIPFGTVLVDTKSGERFVVEDRGGAIKGDKLDLYVGRDNRKDALQYGVQYHTFYIYYMSKEE